MLVLWTGLAAGATHVITGVDHLAALLPLSVGRRAGAFALGARWGLGHSAGVVIVAALGVALRERLDLGAAEALGERGVGVMLIAIGLLGLRSALRIQVHSHGHRHGDSNHAHLHLHLGLAGGAAAHEPAAHAHRHTAFAAGTLHGVAGTAHILGVLPALALPDATNSLVYLASFAIGTIVTMGGFAALVGFGSARAGQRSGAALKGLLYASSLGALLVGIAWLARPLLGFEALA
jgi:hypothetical protein